MYVKLEALLPLGAAWAGVQAGIQRVPNSLHCKSFTQPNSLRPTHLCCDTVKQIRICCDQVQIAKEVTMPALAEVPSTGVSHPDPRGRDLPACPVCADSMVAAEASAYLSDNFVSYLWSCETCGYGFVTKHSLKRFACN
jgi:hypothetical protein